MSDNIKPRTTNWSMSYWLLSRRAPKPPVDDQSPHDHNNGPSQDLDQGTNPHEEPPQPDRSTAAKNSNKDAAATATSSVYAKHTDAQFRAVIHELTAMRIRNVRQAGDGESSVEEACEAVRETVAAQAILGAGTVDARATARTEARFYRTVREMIRTRVRTVRAAGGGDGDACRAAVGRLVEEAVRAAVANAIVEGD